MRMTSRALAAGALIGLSALAAGCSKEQGDTTQGAASATADQSQTAAITPEAREEAQQIFGTRCAVCHGAEGRGDGPGGAALSPTPRNFHDAAWQEGVTDQDIERAIVYGGAAVGKSPAMVGNPDLGAKPAVVAALKEMIRDLGKQN